MYVYYNPNPDGKVVGDCVIRALTKAFNDSWNNIFADLTMVGSILHDMPNSNHIWGEYLKMNGFKQHRIPDTCPFCYTISEFAKDHPYGTYIVATGTHVVCVVDGNYFDTADSGMEVPLYFFEKES